MGDEGGLGPAPRGRLRVSAADFGGELEDSWGSGQPTSPGGRLLGPFCLFSGAERPGSRGVVGGGRFAGAGARGLYAGGFFLVYGMEGEEPGCCV